MRWLIFGIFVGVFLGSYSIGAASTIPDEEAKAFLEEFKMSVEGISALEIFAHNASVALAMFVPGFGVGWGVFTAWSTGLAFKSIVTANPVLEKIPPLAVLLISPFGLMELAAYSMAMSRSVIWIRIFIKRMPIKPEIRTTTIEVGIVVALLLVAGFIEFAMINQTETGVMTGPGS